MIFAIIAVVLSILYIPNVVYSQDNSIDINIYEPVLEIMNQSKNSNVGNLTGFLTDVNVTDDTEDMKKSDGIP